MRRRRAKEVRGLSALINLVIWVTGVFVSLAVGFGMISGTLPIWFVHPTITSIVGWIVVILTLLGALLAIIERLS